MAQAAGEPATKTDAAAGAAAGSDTGSKGAADSGAAAEGTAEGVAEGTAEGTAEGVADGGVVVVFVAEGFVADGAAAEGFVTEGAVEDSAGCGEGFVTEGAVPGGEWSARGCMCDLHIDERVHVCSCGEGDERSARGWTNDIITVQTMANVMNEMKSTRLHIYARMQ